MITINPKNTETKIVQEYLLSSVGPRPIALASTIDNNNIPNLSPFSFFNVFSGNPPILIFSPARRIRNNTEKDTLNNLKEIQTFLNCNGFNPGPIDGLSGSRTDGAIKSFQKTVGLTADGEVGPATKQAMRSYSSVSFTFKGSGWGHGVGLSQYGAKGLTELGASFCSNTSSCSSSEVVNYYFNTHQLNNYPI